MSKKIKLFLGFLLFCTAFSFAQMQEYDYKREIGEVTDQWHKVTLPNGLFKDVKKDLAAIRVYGINNQKDTIEAPYILKQLKSEIKTKQIPFTINNRSHNANGYYYTFKTNGELNINQLFLDFKKQNFDWKVTLEASENQNEWFTVVEDYRIVAIKNESVNYKFTKVVFPKSKYTYYRLLVKTDVDPKLTTATFNLKTTKNGKLNNYTITNKTSNTNKKKKQTTIFIELDEQVPVNKLFVNTVNTTTYYRHYTLSYMSNRFKTEKGWMENYKRINSGVLNSIEKDTINFRSVFTNKLKLVIDNQDNAPLQITNYTCSGYAYELTTRFDEKASYYLVSGRKNDRHPNYDVVHSDVKLPENISQLTIGNPIAIEKIEKEKGSALFENKIWLWAIMLVIIGLLIGFSLKMMKDK